MAHDRSSAVWPLVALHLLLALVPLAVGYLPIDYQTVPVILCVASVPFSQIMLLSVWVGMAHQESLALRAILAALGTAYVAIWSVWGEILMPSPSPIGMGTTIVSVYLRVYCVFLVLLAGLSGAAFGMRRVMGTIRPHNPSDLDLAAPRFRFSLFGLFAAATLTALMLGLARLSQFYAWPRPQYVVAAALELSLAALIFAISAIVTIWATLSPGPVGRRLCVAAAVSVVLGFVFAMGSGTSSPGEPWWLFFSLPLVAIVPTTLVALSLLYLRRLGFRLVPPKGA